MSASSGPRLREQRTVRPNPADDVCADPAGDVRCGLIDISLADVPTSIVFGYPVELDFTALATGLSIALNRIPVFSARLRTDGDELYLVNPAAGVPFAHAEADETLADALSRLTRTESGFVDHVRANAARTEDRPLFTARLTALADGASLLGLSWHHAVGDLQSVLLLLQTWSAAVADHPLPQPILVRDRDRELIDLLPETDCGRPSFRLPDSPDEAELIKQTVAAAPLANRTVQLYFGPDELQRMRTAVSEEAGRALSINDVVCGHLSATLWDLAEDDQPRRLAVPVNVRRYLGLPAELIGNVLGEIVLTRPAHSGAAELAGAVRDGVENFARDHFSGRANHEYLARIGRSELSRCIPIGFDPGRRMIVLSNWSKFGLYDLEFSGHRPIAFSPAAIGQIAWIGWLVEGFAGQGLLATLALPARLAAAVRKPEAQAELHRFRRPEDELPELVGQLRKLG